MTRNRTIIKEILFTEQRHLSAVELWEKARSQGANISLATVYNSLKHLLSQGEIIELRFGEGKAVYDARLDEHAHIHCTNCGRIEDIDFGSQIAKIRKEVTKASDYLLHSAEVTLKGICSPCQKGSHRPITKATKAVAH